MVPVAQLQHSNDGRGRLSTHGRHRRHNVRQSARRRSSVPFPLAANRLQLSHRQLGSQRLPAGDRRPAAVDGQRVSRPLGIRSRRLQRLAASRRTLLHRLSVEHLHHRSGSLHRYPVPNLVPRAPIIAPGAALRRRGVEPLNRRLCTAVTWLERPDRELRARQHHRGLPLHPVPVAQLRPVLGQWFVLRPVLSDRLSLRADLHRAAQEDEEDATDNWRQAGKITADEGMRAGKVANDECLKTGKITADECFDEDNTHVKSAERNERSTSGTNRSRRRSCDVDRDNAVD